MSPTLSQVLSAGGIPVSFNLGYVALALAAICAAALSAVKGYEVLQRRRLSSLVEGDLPDFSALGNGEKIKRLSYLVHELKSEKKHLIERNHGLQNQINVLEPHTKVEDALRQSNLSLSRKYAKLHAEIEKRKARPKIKAVKNTKRRAGRKPLRVSRKGR